MVMVRLDWGGMRHFNGAAAKLGAAMDPLPDTLPPRPEPPQGYDCCGGGCADCELRIYLRELGRWQKLEAAMIAAGKLPGAGG
jgi:hypothetical protein